MGTHRQPLQSRPSILKLVNISFTTLFSGCDTRTGHCKVFFIRACAFCVQWCKHSHSVKYFLVIYLQNILSVTRPELNATEVYNTIKSSYPSSVVLLNGSEVVKLPVGLYEIMPWTEFNATEAAPAGNMELAYHKYTHIYIYLMN